MLTLSRFNVWTKKLAHLCATKKIIKWSTKTPSRSYTRSSQVAPTPEKVQALRTSKSQVARTKHSRKSNRIQVKVLQEWFTTSVSNVLQHQAKLQLLSTTVMFNPSKVKNFNWWCWSKYVQRIDRDASWTQNNQRLLNLKIVLKSLLKTNLWMKFV